MRKALLLIVLAVMCLCFAGPLFAQQSSAKSQGSEYYYFSFDIEKIYVHRLGYIVSYRQGLQTSRAYLPAEWFTDVGGRGEVIMLNTGNEWPSFTVFYKNGEFSHVKLRLRRDRGHLTWGVVPQHLNMDEYFQGIDEITLQF